MPNVVPFVPEIDFDEAILCLKPSRFTIIPVLQTRQGKQCDRFICICVQICLVFIAQRSIIFLRYNRYFSHLSLFYQLDWDLSDADQRLRDELRLYFSSFILALPEARSKFRFSPDLGVYSIEIGMRRPVPRKRAPSCVRCSQIYTHSKVQKWRNRPCLTIAHFSSESISEIDIL
jgi:hypothetical protein